MIEVKVSQLLQVQDILREMVEMEFPVAEAIKTMVLAKEVEEKLKIVNDLRKKIINKYGEKDQNGEVKTNSYGQISIPPDKVNEYIEEYHNYENGSITIQSDLLPRSVLEYVTKITPKNLLAIEPFLEKK